jgi:hypothetical protein
VTFDDHHANDEYMAEHGQPNSFGDWLDYAQDNATFWVKLNFSF